MTPIDAQQPVTVTFLAHEWSAILAALNEAPHRVARPLIDGIMAEVEAVAKAQAGPHEADLQGGASAA